MRRPEECDRRAVIGRTAIFVCCSCCMSSCAAEDTRVFGDEKLDATSQGGQTGAGGSGAKLDAARAPDSGEIGETCDAGPAGAAICGCTLATAVDLTGLMEVTVPFTGKYNPRCMKATPGVTVTWTGNFLAHPLLPSSCAGDVADNPVHDVDDPNKTSLSITFPAVGTFPYYCPDHANDVPSPAGMCGVVYVVP